jgi:lipopolysaccharide transport system ATP-binding protein
MANNVVVSAHNLSKAYRIWDRPSSRLVSPALEVCASVMPASSAAQKHLLQHARRHYRDFYAVRDVSFELRKGESLGIIGRNGSGKSTLLQILARTLEPTSGEFSVTGRVAALLELGSGFNPEFTGRENVMLNGAILGFSRQQMEKLFPQIADFADIGDFVDQPVKTYSSGMLIRLAFAVAINVQPDILVVDEALSVGDVFFQQKCFQRIHEILKSGTTFLFVSHQTAAVQNLCDRAILMHQGEAVYVGSPDEAVSRYYAVSGPATQRGAAPAVVRHEPTKDRDRLEAIMVQNDIRPVARGEHGARDLEVVHAAVLNGSWHPATEFKVGDTMVLAVQLRAKAAVADPSSGLHFYDKMGNIVFAAGTRQLRVPFADFAPGETRTVEFRMELSVQPGEYTFSVGCAQGSDEGPNLGFIQHRLEGLGPISVSPATEGTWPFYGIARLPLGIRIHG